MTIGYFETSSGGPQRRTACPSASSAASASAARPAMALDHVAVTALCDTMVPAAFSRLGRVVAVPTLDLTIHFRAPLPPPGDGWALAVYRSGASAGGVWEEDGELWSRDGVLLAQSRQLALLLPPSSGPRGRRGT